MQQEKVIKNGLNRHNLNQKRVLFTTMDKRFENTIYGMLTGAILVSEVLPIHNFGDNTHLGHKSLTETLKEKCGPVFLASQNVLEERDRSAKADERSEKREIEVDTNAFSLSPTISPYHWDE